MPSHFLNVLGRDQTERRLLELVGIDPKVSFSPHCWKTKMALAHKGLGAQTVPVRFSEIGHTALDDRRQVPILIDAGTAIADSWDIAMHLDTRYVEGPALFGHPMVVFCTRMINGWVDEMLLPILSKILSQDIWACIGDDDRVYYRQSRERRFDQRLEDVWSERVVHLARFRQRLDPLREKLAHQRYLGGILEGDSPRYADYSAFAPFMWVRCVSPLELLEEGDPIADWRDNLLDAFDGMGRRAPRFQS